MHNDNDDDQAQPVNRHPEALKVGATGVFAGDWAWTGEPARIPVGFAGTLVDYWNGWAVWRCTREVAQAVVADQQRLRAVERARLAERGVAGADLERLVDEQIAPMWFDGDDLVLDETARYDEPAVARHGPGPDGQYHPMAYNWTWTVVNPADCDHVVGYRPYPA